jgi:hypothetical protein
MRGAFETAASVPLLAPPDETYAANIEEKRATGPAVSFTELDSFDKLGEGDAFRVWAHAQGRAICEAEQEKAKEEKAELNFYVAFALAECYFKLAESEKAEKAFSVAERRLDREFGEDLEKRKLATLHESLLICHSRELVLHLQDKEERSKESKVIRQASRDAQAAVQGMAQPNVTVFSQIQRRNISQSEFKAEIEAIVDQEEDRLD